MSVRRRTEEVEASGVLNTCLSVCLCDWLSVSGRRVHTASVQSPTE